LIHAANFLKLRNEPHSGKAEGTLRQEMLEELSHHAARALMSLEQFIRGEL